MPSVAPANTPLMLPPDPSPARKRESETHGGYTMKHIIWSNMDVNPDDYADFLREEYPEVTDPRQAVRTVLRNELCLSG